MARNKNYYVPEHDEKEIVVELEHFETDAYEEPSENESMKTTFMGKVGIGGPVPIVAPKHNTIQLQPIVVPLAVVPYMTQDSSTLRTQGQTETYAGGDYMREASFESISTVSSDELKGSIKKKARAFSVVVMILALLVTLPFILSKFMTNIGSMSIMDFNIIASIELWAQGTAPASIAIVILNLAAAVSSALLVIICLFGLFLGRFPKMLNCCLSLISSAPLLGILIYKVVNNEFNVQTEAILLSLVIISLLTFVLIVIFGLVLMKKQDQREKLIDDEI